MKLNFSTFLIILILILNIVAGTVIGIQLWQNYQAYKQAYKQGKFVVYKPEDVLEGATTGPEIVDVDFAKQTATGSPLIFGGAHAPSLNHQDAWNKIQEVGVTAIRRDFFIENELPKNITLEDYKKNINDVQNPETWNIQAIKSTNDIYANAKKRKMKIMGILSYVPSWLTYSNTRWGVPKDWQVFEDIVKKTYRLHRDYLDYLEIWNEPTIQIFLDLKGSNMSREEAYFQIYYHAYKAIREVDKNIPIGGPVSHNPLETKVLDKLLKEDRTKNSIDFVSYHNYEDLPEPSWTYFKQILTEYQKDNLPIFITEWNYYIEDKEKTFKSSYLAIEYTGDKFINFLKMGLSGAFYFALVDMNRPNYLNDDLSMGFYRWENNQATLLPQTKTWRLLSKTLALGKGQSKVMETVSDESVNAVGFENVDKKQGMAIVNETNFAKIVEVNFNNLKTAGKTVNVTGYLASVDNDGANPTGKQNISINNGSLTFKLYLPPQSVVGILVN